MFNLFKPFDLFKIGYSGSTYNPLINYDWSTTTTSGLRYLKDVGSTPTYNASMYFGRGAYLNGVDQTITVPINTTIQTSLKRVNGVVTISETSQTLTNYVISGLGVHKDYYLFTRLLTTAEKDSYTNTPELFYAMAQVDSTCVLNMPMCETSSTARNYKTGIDYQITNYTSSVRDNAKNLQYGLQTCKFVRDSLGVIQSASDYLECDGAGYGDTGWVLNTHIFDIEFIFNMKDFSTRGSFESIFGVREATDANIQNICLTLSTTNNNIVVITGNSWGQTFNVPVGKSHFILRYDGTSIYLIRNGISIYNKITTITPNLDTLFFGAEQYIASVRNKLNSELRLFKIHSAIQDPQELYNKALAKGLLS